MKNFHYAVFGHDFFVTETITNYIKEYTCKNCKRQVTTDGNGNLTALTPKLKEINLELKRIHNKKQKRQVKMVNL